MMYLKSDSNSISRCVNALIDGKIIIIPTDTVYGFSGIVDNVHDTDYLIRKIKGRAETKPFIQLIGTPEEIRNYTDDIIPDSLLKYWPGPLTIIVHNKESSSTTAYRCPNDLWLCKILQEIRCPIYSTSANRSGFPIFEKVNLLEQEFSKEVEFIIDDGNRIGGIASTIVSIENQSIKVLRQGAVKINL